jgi:hypothetical protein
MGIGVSAAYMVIFDTFVENNERYGFLEDLMRCILTKKGSDMSEFHDLLTHLSCMREFTGRKDRTSATSSSGRIAGDGALRLRRSRDLEGGIRIGAVLRYD